MRKTLGIWIIVCSLFFQLSGFCEDYAVNTDVTGISVPGIEFSISVAYSFIIPITDYANFYDYGHGTYLEFALKNVFTDNLGFAVCLAHYSVNSLNLNENSLLSIPLTLFINYNFQLSGRYTIVPCLGFGYMLHMVSTIVTRDFFFNPEISAKCRTTFKFNDALMVFMTQGYTIYFETSNVGQYLNFDIGIELLL